MKVYRNWDLEFKEDVAKLMSLIYDRASCEKSKNINKITINSYLIFMSNLVVFPAMAVLKYFHKMASYVVFLKK